MDEHQDTIPPGPVASSSAGSPSSDRTAGCRCRAIAIIAGDGSGPRTSRRCRWPVAGPGPQPTSSTGPSRSPAKAADIPREYGESPGCSAPENVGARRYRRTMTALETVPRTAPGRGHRDGTAAAPPVHLVRARA
jgi:hypothetical protein